MGPVDESLLVRCGVRAETLVWCTGMDNWMPAHAVFGNAMFASNGNTPPPVPQNGSAPQSAYNNGNNNPSANFNQNHNNTTPQRPTNYLGWSIACTVLCCIPLGIMGILSSNKAEKEWNNGNYDEAVRQANLARNYCIIAAVAGAVFGFIYFIVVLASM